MGLAQLRYILAVDKFRHFHKAAESCHVTQPTLSMQIAKFERSLNIMIFDRSKSPILPTEMGMRLIDQARVILREYDRLHQIIQDKNNAMVGTFRLGVIPTLSPYLIPSFLKHFQNQFPEVELFVEEMKTEQMIEELEKDRIDGGLLVTPLYRDSLIERVIGHEDFVIYIHPEHRLAQKKQISALALQNEDLWILKDGHCFRNQVLNLCQLDKKSSGFHFESGNIETLKKLVQQNGGVTIIPRSAIMPNYDREFIKEFKGKIPAREISLVHHRPFLKEKIIEELEALIITNLPEAISSHKSKKFSIIDIT